VTDGLPALGLATDPIDPGVLARPPRDPGLGLLHRRFFARVVGIGCLTAGVALAAFAWNLEAGVETARTAAFSVIVFDELLRAFAARSETLTIWEVGLLSNLRLFAIVVVSFALQLLLLNVSVLATVFGTTPASPADVAVWLALGLVPVTVIEVAKLVSRRRAVPGRLPRSRPDRRADPRRHLPVFASSRSVLAIASYILACSSKLLAMLSQCCGMELTPPAFPVAVVEPL
jgi:Ca2+-transporting ATPase